MVAGMAWRHIFKRVSSAMKRNIFWLITGCLLIIAGWRIMQSVGERAAAVRKRQVRNGAVVVLVEAVSREDIRDSREFTGTVSAKSQFIVAPKVPGRLNRLLVDIGQEVRNGELIVQLDSQEYQQQVEQARAEMDVALANVSDARSVLDIAGREFERARQLRQQKVASESELDQAEARHRAALAKHDVSLAQVKQQEAILKATVVRLSYTEIRATWEDEAGGTRVVGERFADEGTMLKANEAIVSILDLDTVIASIFVIEGDYPLIHTGQQARVMTDAFPGQNFYGTIVRKSPLLQESSRQARVEIEIQNQNRQLVPGMFIRAAVEFSRKDKATVVPAASLVRRYGSQGVFKVEKGGSSVRFVEVRTGIASGGKIEIVDPALDGAVVVMGQHLLADGSMITIAGMPMTDGKDNRKGNGGD